MSTATAPTTAGLSSAPAGPVPAEDPAARIGALREQIDACDAQIIELIQRRLEISREIGSLRTATGGTRLSLSREAQVLARFESALGADGTAVGMMLLRQGRGRL